MAALTMFGVAVGIGSADARGGGDTERIDIRDDCDPVTFNAALFPGACIGDGDTTFEDLVERLQDRGFHGAWRFNPDDTDVDTGTKLRLVNRGGEFHTFTPVDRFGPGCALDVNELAGFVGDPVMPCTEEMFINTGIDAKTSQVLAPLPVGTHLFECAIHPWMQTTITVKGHHH
ncbi:hypothetical protein N802_09265 [Knoellia sinensis KCTC 19936]|uniref:Uncharacterized protein n=1 Tax=Knoellia sinensis KCTC 19936 TaxID=1385520 RepID=A0A0A0IZT4_9MICO|nr:hypothetical protein N802_09265 [Knoellia sinensis KCTC 19936]